MVTIFKITLESIRQALQQLQSNKLRSFLSLLGISIGIFCIIGVLSAVDSLEDNVRGSLEKLGNDVLYVKKWPWEDIGGEWWKYVKRPNPDHEDYEVLSERTHTAALTAYHVIIGLKTVKYKSSNVNNTMLIGSSLEFAEMFKINFDKGRYFSSAEYHYGSNKIILGYEVAEQLFDGKEPIGKIIKLQGRNYEVIGVIEKSGNNLLDPLDFDDCIVVAYTNARNLVNLKARYIFNTSVTVKAAEGVSLTDLKDEVKGILRSHRRLKPKEDDNFALNELSMISSFFDSFFNVLNLLGIVIGLFAMLVGGVSVANIMFVSVKERTNIIGIKKALGAKRFVILLEFLIESIILCLLGGAIGLLLVYLATVGLTQALGFNFYLDFGNILIGVIVSVMIGVVAGFIPALRAARMDPVDAMRQ